MKLKLVYARLIRCNAASWTTVTSSKSYHSYAPEPAHPIPGRKPKTVSAEDAISVVESGHNVYVQGMAATPIGLVNAMVAHGKKKSLRGVKVHHLYIEGDAQYNAPEYQGTFRSNSFFVTGNSRTAVAEGRADYTPMFLSEISQAFSRGFIKPDVSLVQVTPPDEHGFHSLGLTVDVTREALKHSKYIIGQVNPRLPRTFGDALVHESHFDALVNHTMEIPETRPKPVTDVEKAIAKHIAQNLIEDGATLQMGIGGIPDAVLAECGNHKDLGIHSEMFSDGVVDLVRAGAVTNRLKCIEPGRLTATFLIGTRKLYDFVDNNPFLVMRTADYVNKEFIIAQNPKATAINTCIEVDICGQVCSDTIGSRVYSGFGGQVDFLRGAALGFDGRGKPILALASCTNKGESKIVPFLKTGASVVTTRAHVHYLVTEYGIADMFGKNYRQRAYALIKIAHPDHREKLEKAAFERLKCMPSPD